ncbi:MAG TPA: cell division protein ZapB [Thermoanaerobaculia bacterium]|nr:cell division protein ZapB [Thermoanaerobaculia bacterium]
MKKKTLEQQMVLSGSEEEILARLKERVDKAVAIIQDLRRERDALKAELAKRPDSNERLDQLEKERSEIRNRIESILSNLESLEVSE